jgi:hypothetical protein
MSHRLTALAAFVTVTSSASVLPPVGVVFASDGEGTAPAQEEAFIKHGIELRENHDDEGALAEFRRAYRLSKGGRALAQMALAEQALGRWVDAETHLTQALRHPDDRWIGRNEKLLRQSLTAIQGHTGSLEIMGAVAGAEILINNEKAGTFPTPALLVPAGSVALEIRAPGYLPLIRTVLIPARGLAREQVVLVAAPATAMIDVPRPPPKEAPTSRTGAAASPEMSARSESAPASPASAAGWSNRTRVGAGLAAGGAVGLAVGIIYQVIREQRAGTFNSDHCGVTGSLVTGPTDCPSRYDNIQGAQKFAIAGFVGAAVLGGVGTYLLLSGGSRSGDAVTARASAGLHCIPAAGVGVVCAARF